MTQYFNVRGFLDCNYGDLRVIRDTVARYADRGEQFHLEEESVALYSGGWLYQEREINWIAHAFFGASMKSGGVDLIFDQLREIATLIPEIEGAFFVDDDEGGPSRRWSVANGYVSVT
ncbi:hypothetical protein [Streptomyces sp. NPDC006995]|uniref:hypothetical protein n=1 Tax=unclassified Streptomyces TaxID=2593676 RepID=UPI00341170E8